MTGRQATMSEVVSYPILFEFNKKDKEEDGVPPQLQLLRASASQ
jgi:hypothetical protein